MAREIASLRAELATARADAATPGPVFPRAETLRPLFSSSYVANQWVARDPEPIPWLSRSAPSSWSAPSRPDPPRTPAAAPIPATDTPTFP